MSKLDDLLKQYCPDGVEYKEIQTISKIISPLGKVKSNEYYKKGKYPVIDQGQDYIGGYTDKEIAFPQDEYVLFGDHTCVVKFVDFPFVQGADGIKVVAASKDVIYPKFLYYCMSNIKIDVDYTRHWAKMKVKKIPVPPLVVQKEIVNILDSFAELKAELTAELTARKQQYEYYRDKLLSFPSDGNGEVRWMTIGDLFDFKNGINKGKEYFGKGIPIINFTDVFHKSKLTADDVQGRVDATEEEVERYNVRKGDVFFTRTSETKEEVGMVSVLLEDIPNCIFSGFVLRARPKTDLLLPEYCAYCFSSSEVRKDIVRYASFTTRALTSGTSLSKISIAVPSIQIQKRIAHVLDNFEAICSDLNIGLPAEIEARKKQYEFYRDALLTFMETGGTILTDRQTDRA